MSPVPMPISSRFLAALALAACAGCSTLPVLTPDLARPDPQGVRVQAANGRILSAERSKAILARLVPGTTGNDSLARHLAIEEAVASTPLTLGNRVVMLEDGERTYAAMFAAIAAARDHINMETYILEDDATGVRFADALIARQRAGVQVNLIHDGVGALGTSKEYFERLKNAGVKVLTFNPVNPLAAKAGWDVNQRDHRKLLIVDGRIAFLGGVNISSVYSSGSSGRIGSAPARGRKSDLPWRDTHLQLEGPVVATLQKLFIETWQAQKGETLAPRNYLPPLTAQGKEVVRAIGSGPDDPYSQIYVTLISAIHSAESDIRITNAYFVPDPQLIAALIGAVARGVDVTVIVPSVTDSALVFHAGRSHYEPLLAAGVRIHERRGALLHAKTVLIDGVWASVGSTNLDWRSFLHNQELDAVILGADFGAKMRVAFERDLAASAQITLEAWRRRPIATRAKEWFARLWEYWL